MSKFLDKNVVLNPSKFQAMTKGASNILVAALVSVAYYGVKDGSVPILSRLEGLKQLAGIKQAAGKVAAKLLVVQGREKLSNEQKTLFTGYRAEWEGKTEEEVYALIESWFTTKKEKEESPIKLPQERMKSLHKYLDKNTDTAGMPAHVVQAYAALKAALENSIMSW